MNVMFSKEGFRSLRIAWVILGLAIVAAAAVAWGSLLYLQKEKRDDISSKRALAEAQARVNAAKREREDLKSSSEIFEDLVKRGILQEESRLDLIERLDRLKTRHHLLGLEYEIAAQRPLPLAGGRVFNAVEVLGSRVKVHALALHEGDALAFLEDLAKPERGFNPLSRCTLRKMAVGAVSATGPRVEAECTLEWISLKDKRGNRAN
ncbi:MAG: hypothetical protein IPP91_11635 [Betaproteobacteria bacterium]|nr:hypothetical protein [Betaproteobacteria bacterium]